MTTTGTPTKPQHPWGRRGRHRRPRPRKAVLAAGGLALAAGALSLVRLLPGPGGDAGDVGGFGAEAGPRQDGAGRDTATDRATTPAAAAGTAGTPGASPSATSAMGGLSASPGPGLVRGPSASGPAAPLPTATGGPDTPNAHGQGAEREDADRTPAPGTPRQPQSPRSPQPSRSDHPGPAPTPPPGSATPPTSAPTAEPGDPGLCVPVIGLCVDLRDGDD
ncbi:hypothetical protein ACGH7X_24570 [Streptomyces sp. BBFR51]|uniref:hypothetical protein n=1 Tax=Streptomyces sp. BBFR51 TaxID=3372856 RepID=UPI0037DD0DCE